MTEQPDEMQRKLKDLYWKLRGGQQLTLGIAWGLWRQPSVLQSGSILSQNSFFPFSHNNCKLHHFQITQKYRSSLRVQN